MKIRNQKDFWAGLMFLAFGLAFAIVARNYQMGTAVRMGPAYFPTVLGALMALLGAIVLVRSFFSRVAGEASKVKMSFNFPDLVIGLAVFALLGWVSKAMFGNADWGMLAAVVVLSALAIASRPSSKPLVLIIAGCLAFAYLLKPLGLVLATLLLVFIVAFGGHEYRNKEVAFLAVGLVIFSVVVFVKGLTLPFPICPAIIDNCPIR
jgi:hypothetical protein